jgi:hypothetical protein
VRQAIDQIVREQKVAGIDIVLHAAVRREGHRRGGRGILFEAFVRMALKRRAAAAKTDASGTAH